MTVSSLRETLVATGVEILDADGATELTLREIARRAGVSHGAPRRYFPTHNSLLAAIASHGLRDLADRLDPVLAGKQPARSRLISAA
ncbi:MAG: TetR/AcrR family transcriptional regulator, partial [Rhodococcus sp.]|nr:TetR/AcrR family transcriptional regulator [Rhodococcus sp. (in: high G+C Gram-positive bacteria)]